MNEPIYGHTASGTPLTDDDIQRLADEAERGYDVEAAIARRKGPDAQPSAQHRPTSP